MEGIIKLLSSIVVIVLLLLFIRKKKLLDTTGTVVSTIMAILIITVLGLKYLIILISFLVSASLVSRIGKDTKNKLGQYENTRTTKNVLANGLVPIIIVVLYGLGILPYDIALYGYIGSISAATSDTFSSEIGMLSKEKPKLITTLKEVEPGTDGGITILGLLGGILGGLLIGIVAFILIKQDFLIIIISIISGLAGNLFDSLTGALFERRNILSNEHVNLLCTIVGGITGILLYYLVR